MRAFAALNTARNTVGIRVDEILENPVRLFSALHFQTLRPTLRASNRLSGLYPVRVNGQQRFVTRVFTN